MCHLCIKILFSALIQTEAAGDSFSQDGASFTGVSIIIVIMFWFLLAHPVNRQTYRQRGGFGTLELRRSGRDDGGCEDLLADVADR